MRDAAVHGSQDVSLLDRVSLIMETPLGDSVRRILRTVFMPSRPVVAFCAPALLVAVAVALGMGPVVDPLLWLIYLLAIWATAVLVVAVLHQHPMRRTISFAYRSEVLARLISDRSHRVLTFARMSLVIDMMWAFVNLTEGLVTSSGWLITFGMYYLLLAVMRTLLVGSARLDDPKTADILCATSGVLAVGSAFVVVAFVVLAVNGAGGPPYNGPTLLAAVAYTFFALVTSTRNTLTFHRQEAILGFSIAGVNLVKALVSAFFLELAMVAAFGTAALPMGDDDLNIGCGVLVAVAVLVVGLALVAQGSEARHEQEGA